MSASYYPLVALLIEDLRSKIAVEFLIISRKPTGFNNAK
jgi:hypothetical protein